MPLTVHAPACVIGQHVNVYVRVRLPLTRDLTVQSARRYRVTFQAEVVADVFGDHGAWLIRLLNALPLNPAPKPSLQLRHSILQRPLRRHRLQNNAAVVMAVLVTAIVVG